MLFDEIYTKLKQARFEVFLPGQHKSICTSPYLTLESSGNLPDEGMFTGHELVTVTLFYPMDEYTGMLRYIKPVERAMAEFSERLLMQSVSSPAIDSDLKAHFVTFKYVLPKGL